MFRKFWVRTQRLLMTLWMKLRYGKCLKLNGVAGFRFNTEMIIRNGSVSIGSKVGIDSRVTIAAVDGGNIVIGNLDIYNCLLFIGVNLIKCFGKLLVFGT